MSLLFLHIQYSTRVSNELGAGRPQVARLATIVVICMAMFAGSVISITMILLRKSWGYMYSNEEEVVTYIARMIPVLGVSFFVDGIHTSLIMSKIPTLPRIYYNLKTVLLELI